MSANEEIGKLVLVLQAQIGDLQSKLISATKTVDDYEKKSNSTAKSTKQSWIDSAKGVALGFFGVTTALSELQKGYQAIVNVSKYALEEWKKQEQAVTNLESALGYTSQTLLDQADALQKVTKYGDDQTIQAQALLGAWIKNDEVIARLIPTIQDYAAATGKDLLSATEMITRTIAGEGTALGKTGIKLDENLSKEERIEQIIYKLTKAYGGRAKALAETDTGKLDVIKNDLNESAEILGSALIPFQVKWNELLAETAKFFTQPDLTSTGFAQFAKSAGQNLKTAKQLESEYVNSEENKNKKLLALMQEQYDAKLENDKNKAKPYQRDVLLQLQFYEERTKLLLAEIDADYKLGALTIEDYYAEKKALISDNAAKEIQILEDSKKGISDENNIKDIQLKILIREAQLKTELHSIDQERITDIGKQSEAQKALNELMKKIEAQKALNELMKKIEAETVPIDTTKEGERKKEFDALIARQEEENKLILASKEYQINGEKELIRAKILWQQQQENLALAQDKQRHQEWLELIGTSLNMVADEFQKYYDMRMTIVQTLQQAVEQAEQAGDTARARSLRSQLAEAKSAARRLFYLTQAAAFAQATVNGAAAIVAALKNGWAAAAVAAAAVGLQLGTIMATTISGPGFEEGGSVEGQSGRDKIHARLTRKEFVQPVPTVDYYGTDVMEAMRRRAIPKSLFAGLGNYSVHSPSSGFYGEGGSVNSGVIDSKKGSINITNIVDPNLLQQFLFSQQGQDSIVNVISMNNYSVKRSLNI